MAHAILIPAAGFGRRMRGADKLLEPVGGRPLLARVAGAACATGAVVCVALPAGDTERHAALDGMDVLRASVEDPGEGMAASLRAGLAALPRDWTALAILPADMPEIDAAGLAHVLAAYDAAGRQSLVQATAEDGTPGHPVVFPPDCASALADLKGDEGARSVLQANAHRLRRIALPGNAAITDLDTPEAWAAWRARIGMAP